MHGSTAAARSGQRTAIERVGWVSTGRDIFFFKSLPKRQGHRIRYKQYHRSPPIHQTRRTRPSGTAGERRARGAHNVICTWLQKLARRLVLLARARCGCIVFNKRRGQGRACVGQRIHAHRLLIRTATGARGARPTMCKRVIEHVPLATPWD